MNVLEKLDSSILIGDGAMGTYLYQKGYKGSFEAMNLTDPEAVEHAHREYAGAGADILQTNTYAANRVKLEGYGLEDKVQDINRAGVQLARNASGGSAYVFATVGGIKGVQVSEYSDDFLRNALQEQVDIFLAEPVDGLLLETFYDLTELLQIIRYIRSKDAELPVIAQMALGDVGVMHGGVQISEAFSRLEDAGASVVGLNCRMGPYHILKSLEQAELTGRAYYSAYPNASLPNWYDGRYVYQSNPEYFYKQAFRFKEQGIRLIGGCCGTTPEHVRMIAEAVKHDVPEKTKRPVKVGDPVAESTADKEPFVPLHEKVKNEKTVIVELDPPKKLKTGKFIRGSQAIHDAGADAVTLADNSLASPRIDNLAMGAMLKQQTSARPLLHIACRDRNLIGLQSHLLGLHTIGVRDLLAITGDPSKVGDFPGAKSVYDANSVSLISLIREMNEGRLFSGKSLGEKTNFSIGGAFNPNVLHIDKAVKRLEKKVNAGAHYFMSQPVYEINRIKTIHEAVKELETPVFIGIMPLVSAGNAEFLHNEVPGIQLTGDIRKRMAACGNDSEAAKREGIAIAKELIDETLRYFNGIYLITPFLRYEITAELTKYVQEQTSAGVTEI